MKLIGNKLCKAVLLIIFSLNLISAAHSSDDTVQISIVELNNEQFKVSYTLNREVNRLYFHATPNGARADFWFNESDQFELVQVSDNDLIKRTDDGLFKTVSFIVKVVDITLTQYYRPFSPMLDQSNGVVVHSGQYFVCLELCSNASTSWQVEVLAQDKNIVHFQGAFPEQASWQDIGDGRTFYVGPQLPLESDNLMAVIDSGLPDKLKALLENRLPNIIDRLADKFETPPSKFNKPLVFASYNVGDPERSGSQGGVLNQTISMHWYGLNLEERINENAELWFFTHEIAHLYQHLGSKVDVDEIAWVHEGFAELMAASLLLEVNDELNAYVQSRYNLAKDQCAKGLKSTPIGRATELKEFDLHYKCGMLLHRFILNNAIEELTVFDLWKRYRSAINQGELPSKQTYLKLIKPLLSEQKFLILTTIVANELAPNSTIEQFLMQSAL